MINRMSTHAKKMKTMGSLILVTSLFLFVDTALNFTTSDGIAREPYTWGDRNEIPVKFNLCLDLFGQHPGKKRVIILGNSRPESGFDPKQFDSYFNNETISFNLAIRGTWMMFTAFFLEYMILPKIQPDIIIWDFHYRTFFEIYCNECHVKSRYNDYNILNKIPVRCHMNRYSGMNASEMLQLIKYKSSFLYRTRTLVINPSWEIQPLLKHTRGFNWIPFNEWNEPFESFTHTFIDASNYGMIAENTFQRIKGILDSMSIPVLFVYGPFGHEIIQFDPLDSLLNDLKESDAFLDLNGSPEFTNASLYWDEVHLNCQGAKKYTEMIYNECVSLYQELN
ncbi:DUF1574 domain-containing protein [Candidatus Bathyarchaeota archaeon]|nr:DUF1574 domain-containing protein [Candidatus Bathyarchaeota archaeon]